MVKVDLVMEVVNENHWRLKNQPLMALIPCKIVKERKSL
jgi:hypothetical protein